MDETRENFITVLRKRDLPFLALLKSTLKRCFEVGNFIADKFLVQLLHLLFWTDDDINEIAGYETSRPGVRNKFGSMWVRNEMLTLGG